MKKNRGIPLATLLSRQLKDREIQIAFEERSFYLRIARLISDLRIKKGWTQSELAKAAHVSQPLIARLEIGDPRRTPTFETVSKILSSLGYQMEIVIHPTRNGAA